MILSGAIGIVGTLADVFIYLRFSYRRMMMSSPRNPTTQNIENSLVNAINDSLLSAYPDFDYPEIFLEEPKDINHGDFATSIALKLCKPLKTAPQNLAQKIMENICLPNGVDKMEYAAPGFINFTLSSDYLTSHIAAITSQQNLLTNPANKKDTVIVEYSQPNIAKPLGVHHLLSTIIGQCIYNTYHALGFHTVGINYIGDWGTQFGKLIFAYKTWGSRETIDRDPINELLKLYVRFHEEAEKNPDLNEKGREQFKKLEDGDEENRLLLNWIKEESLKDIQKTYDLLGGVKFDLIQGEAFYEKLMQPVIDEGIGKGIFTEGEGGALVVNFSDVKLPTCLVRKSDGATLYFTRDLAVIKHRTANWHPQKIIYVVDIAQSLHLKQVFTTVQMLWGNEFLPELKHVEFGRMSFPEGKMSTRKGTVILLYNLLLEAVERAKKIVIEKNPDLSEAEVDKIAHIVGTGAVKFAVLSQNRTTNVIFTWEKMLSLEGNSAPYLQYAYARSQSILSKPEAQNAVGDFIFSNIHEINLVRLLNRFERVVNQSAREYKPNIIANYLYDLTQFFHTFYSQCPVLKSSGNQLYTRLQIVKALSRVIKAGLALLGIEVSERM